jgi:hypothetical protein
MSEINRLTWEEMGLRAQLIMQSFIAGQLMIELDFYIKSKLCASRRIDMGEFMLTLIKRIPPTKPFFDCVGRGCRIFSV